jgi:hypothetical protein
MVRDESSASRVVKLAVVAAVVGAVVGVIVQRFVIGDADGATAGGLLGAVLGAVGSLGFAGVRERRAEEAARSAPVNVPWPLTVELARRAFREPLGELAWKRADAPAVIAALQERGQAVVEGEVWFVKPDGRHFEASLTDKLGRVCSWTWDCKREPEESWRTFLQRCAEEARENVANWPELEDIPESFEGEPHYHFTWKGERGKTEFDRSSSGSRTPAG